MRIALAALVAALVAVAPAGAGTAQLRVVDFSPVTLRGAGFGSGERIEVRLKLGERTAKRLVRADRGGRFVARFAGFVYDRCHGALTVDARGGRGTHGGFTLQPLECPAGGGSS